MGWVKYSTIGAKAGDNIKDESGNVLDNEDIRNDDLTLAYSGTNIQLKKAGSQIGSNVDSPDALKNAQISISSAGALSNAGGGTVALASMSGSSGYNNQSITVNSTTGVLENIGTSSIKVNNAKQDWQDVSGTGIPADNATVGATWGDNIGSQPSDTDILNSGTFTGTIGSGGTSAGDVHTRIGKITNAGEFSGSLATAQFPMRAAITAANAGASRTAIGAGADWTASGTGTVHANNYTDTTYTFVYGDITVVEGGAAAVFTSYDNGSNYVASNQTGKISITHPTSGTYTVDYAWADLDGDNLDGFTLSNPSANSTWSASTFVAGTAETIVVTHSESSNKTINMSAVTIKHNYGSGGGGGGGCFLPGTPVALLNGESKEIEKIEMGDECRGGGTVISKQSYQVDYWYQLDTLWTTLELTAGHPVWIEDKGWSCIDPEEYYRECEEFGHTPTLKPQRIEVGDKTTDGEIKFLERVEEKQEVWNITVDNEHTYYVNGILVHNGDKN